MWIVGDNLRKGAALNAIQVFELVARNGWQTPAVRRAEEVRA
jgi:N-acetyl-gamma-glutamylphosphate reductase